jgi:hypothetical protein
MWPRPSSSDRAGEETMRKRMRRRKRKRKRGKTKKRGACTAP